MVIIVIFLSSINKINLDTNIFNSKLLKYNLWTLSFFMRSKSSYALFWACFAICLDFCATSYGLRFLIVCYYYQELLLKQRVRQFSCSVCLMNPKFFHNLGGIGKIAEKFITWKLPVFLHRFFLLILDFTGTFL